MPLLSHQAEPNQLQRPGSLKDLAYREIKRQLVSGRLQHDRIYSALHFGEQLGISRTPAREALLQLAHEGFLICLDVRGFKIKEFSEKEIRDVFETRQVIEAYAVDRAAGELSAQDRKHVQECLREMAARTAEENIVSFLEADKEFHLALVRCTNNVHLISIMEKMRDYLSIFGVKVLAQSGRSQEVLREHQRIVTALNRGDRGKAVAAIRDHLTITEKYLLG
jgi:DNA-binding GntR family transcriptional regulator